ncbi:MAG: SurA N-terminal domain-containing protein [Candidatus Omnitrophica bacterium]|nr:SurA N-terminal domain-containing protein [Candidatus Omnitrophota bacterium]
MLSILHKKKVQKRILIGLAVIIIPAFVFWGAGSAIRSKNEPTHAGTAFGRKITFSEYQDSLNAVRNLALMRFGEEFEKIKDYLNLNAQAWERILLLEEAKKRKIKISDTKVIESVRAFPFFQENGGFNKERYENVLHYSFLASPRKFEEQIRSSLMIEELYKRLTGDISVNEEEAAREYKKSNEKVKVEYIAALPGSFTAGIEVSDEELRDFLNKNPQSFRIGLAVNVEYIGLDHPADATEEMKEQAHKKMREISSKVSENDDLKKAAEENNLRIKETGFISTQEPIPGIGFSPNVFEEISRLKKGRVSGAIPTAVGVYILKIKDRKENYLPPFEEIKNKVRETLIYDLAKEEAREKLAECLQKIDKFKEGKKDIDLGRMADEFGLKKGNTEPFGRDSYIPEIGNYKGFWEAAFNLKKKGEISPLLETPSGFYVLKLNEFIGVDEGKFAKEKEAFSKRLLEEKKEKFFQGLLAELHKKANLQILSR